jgi:hypothetical protein
MLEATLALATIIRDVEIHSSGSEFPVTTPFTAVAAGPVWAIVRKVAHGGPRASRGRGCERTD